MSERQSGCFKWGLVGCSTVAVLFVLSIGACFVVLRGPIQEIGKAKATREGLEEKLGVVSDYLPPASGAIPAERLAVFVAVRESLGEAQAELEVILAKMPPNELNEMSGGFFSRAGSAFGALKEMISAISNYVDQRDQQLIIHEMGLGEYLYIYGTVYSSWLGHAPSAGPLVTKATRPEAAKQQGEDLFEGEDSSFAPQRVQERYHVTMLHFLERQLGGMGDLADPGWRSTLEEEIARLRADPSSWAWQNGLPPAAAEGLEAMRERLEATWHQPSNCFEYPELDDES